MLRATNTENIYLFFLEVQWASSGWGWRPWVTCLIQESYTVPTQWILIFFERQAISLSSKITMPHYSRKETPNNKSNKKGRNTVFFPPEQMLLFCLSWGGKSAEKQQSPESHDNRFLKNVSSCH